MMVRLAGVFIVDLRAFFVEGAQLKARTLPPVNAPPMKRVVSLNIGDKAPDFDVTAHDGRRLRLADFAGKKNLVLYFYPKDFTLVCTQEACGFRDMYDDLVGKDTEVIGVSVDDDDSHGRFAKKHGVTFPLVADSKKELASKYKATGFLSDLMGSTNRVTYLIDKSGTVAGVFDSRIRASQHLDGVKQGLAALAARG
jgi:peroxiredoxin Q/BCP